LKTKKQVSFTNNSMKSSARWLIGDRAAQFCGLLQEEVPPGTLLLVYAERIVV
jgi:hypothetical protein